MRIIKDGPYSKTIYVDTGYVLSNDSVVSNHVFMGNTRVASIVKHKDEPQAATYYYASDHLGSSSVLTNQAGSYHERIEYLPYGEVWVEDASITSNYRTPYKFTGKELDKETGLYYFGARYYDARVGRWVSADPIYRYTPKFSSTALNLYQYGLLNPLKYIDPDGTLEYDWEKHQFYITKGDTLTSISKETGYSISEIMGENPNIKNPNKIKAGEKINFPSERKALQNIAMNNQMKTMRNLENKNGILTAGKGKEAKQNQEKHNAFYREYLMMSGNSYLPNSIENDEASHVKVIENTICITATTVTGVRSGHIAINYIYNNPGLICFGIGFVEGLSPSGPSTTNNLNEAKGIFWGIIYDMIFGK
jgi:RHS repeat-associated protein